MVATLVLKSNENGDLHDPAVKKDDDQGHIEKMESMIEKVLEIQQKRSAYLNLRLDEAVKKQEALVKGKAVESERHQVDAISDNDFGEVLEQEKLEEYVFLVESSMFIGSSYWCRSTPTAEATQTSLHDTHILPSRAVLKHTTSIENITMELIDNNRRTPNYNSTGKTSQQLADAPEQEQSILAETSFVESIDRRQKPDVDRHQMDGHEPAMKRQETKERIPTEKKSIEFLQTPGRIPASGSPLGGTPVPRYERQLDGLQSQVTELHKTREETNPELSSEVQSLKEKLNEHSKQLEQSAKNLSLLESENLNLRDKNQALNTASNKKRDTSTREKAKDAQTYDVEDSESEPEPDKEAPEGATKAGSPMVTYLEQMFSKRHNAKQSMVERLLGVAPPIQKSNPDSYVDTPFTDEITLIEMHKKFSFP
ncbi:hypothetical protein F2Q70_00021593 [Brassica cretica]|uniref:Uncharacterized protein n=1 Tax=Brassica cretica TaxID=69181 RepID=A0A8S9GWJ3_BRACR|nr:hypothetical protein F2Q70_00021593 [Brassica cretica]